MSVKLVMSGRWTQWAPHRSARRRAVEIARRVGRLQVPPALKRAIWAWRHQNHFGIEHKSAAPDTVLVAERPHGANGLPAHDLAANDPVERTAVGQFLGALGHHAGAVDVFGYFAAFALVFELLPDPALEITDGIAADAEFDEMQGHGVTLTRFRRLDHHDLCAFHNLRA